MVEELGARGIILFSDSQLVTQQVKGEYETKEAKMRAYLERVMNVKNKFYTFEVEQILREKTMKVDELSKLASFFPRGGTGRIILVTTHKEVIESMIGAIQEADDWRMEILEALSKDGK